MSQQTLTVLNSLVNFIRDKFLHCKKFEGGKKI